MQKEEDENRTGKYERVKVQFFNSRQEERNRPASSGNARNKMSSPLQQKNQRLIG